MEWSSSNVGLSDYLNSKQIEETVGSGKAYYRPAHLAHDKWGHELKSINHKQPSRPYYLLSVRLAGLPVLHVRLPEWVTVRSVLF